MSLHYKQLKPYRDYQRDKMLELRLFVLTLLAVAGFVFFAGVFWYFQIVQGPSYLKQAEENRLRRQVDRPLRGVIRDVTGQVLVTNRPAFSVFLDRQAVKDPEASVGQLSSTVHLDEQMLRSRLEKASKLPRFIPVRLTQDVGLETVARIESRRPELPGVDVIVESKRYYPLGAAAAHVIGYLSEVTGDELEERESLLPGDLVGRVGIEQSYDDDLRGIPGLVLEEINASGRSLRTVATVDPTQHGRPLKLTIDAQLQLDLAEQFEGKRGAAVFVDPRSGAVRAIFSAPSFDPNLFSGKLSPQTWKQLTEDPAKPLQNRALAGAYSPGSTFKIVMAMAAIEAGAVAVDEPIYCPGYGRFYGRRFHCHKRSGHGWVDLRTAITRSCNLWFYTAGQRLGIEEISNWAKRLGLGASTSLPLRSQVSGLVPSEEWKRRVRGQPWFPGETISVAIGQGPLNVTPLQMALVAAAVANGGNVVKPHLRQGADEMASPEPLGLSAEAMAAITQGMVDVVESKRGTARRARIEGVSLAGKTGTAQVVALDAAEDPGDHAWFIGFGPVPDPELAWAIIVENAGGGGREAAPIAGAVVKKYLESRGLIPDDSEPPVEWARNRP